MTNYWIVPLSLLVLLCLTFLIPTPPPTPFAFLPPGSFTSDTTFLLGTDAYGRDLFLLLAKGLCLSLLTGAIACLIAGLIGLSMGLVSALYGGRIDLVLVRLIQLKLSIPTLLIALLAHITFGQSLLTLSVAMGISGWAYLALMARSIAKTEANKTYTHAAQLLGLSPLHLVRVHLLPNCLPPLLPFLTYRFAHFIMLESALSFLGLGLPQFTPSLGHLMNEGMDYMLTGTYWVALFPALLLSVVLVTIHATADRLLRTVF